VIKTPLEPVPVNDPADDPDDDDLDDPDEDDDDSVWLIIWIVP